LAYIHWFDHTQKVLNGDLLNKKIKPNETKIFDYGFCLLFSIPTDSQFTVLLRHIRGWAAMVPTV